MMATNSPVIDLKFLENMLKLSKGNPKFVVDTIQKFLIAAPKGIREIQMFKVDHNRDDLKQKAHKFMSTCSVVGAMRMINVCYRLSSKAKTEDEKQLRIWLDQLNDEFEIASEHLNDYVSKVMSTAL